MSESLPLTPARQIWSDALISPLQAGFFACEPDWRLPERVRPHYQIWLTTSGRAQLTIGAYSLELEEGVAAVVPPYLPHRGSHLSTDPLHCYVLHFTIRVLGSIAPLALGTLPWRLQLGPTAWQEIRVNAGQVCHEFTYDRPGHALIANGSMTRLVGLLWREAMRRDLPEEARGLIASNDSLARLSDVFMFIAEHFAEPLSLADLAHVAHLSRAHFSTVFRRATGLSPFQYVHRYRIQRARELLATTHDSISDIARAVGVADPFYFSRAFKRAEGISPTEFRQTKQNPWSP